MVLAYTFIAVAFLANFALGALPVPGAPYRIQNVQTNLVIDNDNALTNAGNPIRGIDVHNPPVSPLGPAAQRISVHQAGVVLGSTTAGLFDFLFPMTGVGAFVKGPPAAGLALNAQNFSTQFLVTEVSTGVYTIAFPFTDFALACPAVAQGPIALQPLNASNPLQQWKFVADSV